MITEEEYLRTSFPDLDQEFRDGEFVERSIPDLSHGTTQADLSYHFVRLRREKGVPVFAASDVRHRVGSGRYLIPDVAVYWPQAPTQNVPEIKPLIAIEILSPDDRMSAVCEKLREYVEWGVTHVWLVDPQARLFYVNDRTGLREVTSLPAAEVGVEITPSDLFEPAGA